MCVLIAVNNWVIGLTGNWYSISVIFLTIGIFNLEQAVQYFGQNNKHQALDHLRIPASQCPLYPMHVRTH